MNLREAEPAEVRAAIRAGDYDGPTAGFAPDFVQTNLVVIPSDHAGDMADLCARNPVPCALIETLAPGKYAPQSAPDADIRTESFAIPCLP